MFSHGFQMVRVRRINNGFIGLNGFLGASKGVHLSPLGFAACQSKKCTNQAKSDPPTDFTLSLQKNATQSHKR